MGSRATARSWRSSCSRADPARFGILLSIGVAQARALRGHAERPWRWLGANVAAWLLGLPWTFAVPMALPDDAPAPAFFVAMTIGAVGMGATTGLVTGLALRRLDPVAEVRSP